MPPWLCNKNAGNVNIMASSPIHLTGVERFFDEDELIASKTDTKGRVTYANDVFLRLAGYTEKEILGQPHSIIRHPDMPRCIFKFLWDNISQGTEIFAYVVNRSKNGDHYWVLAHVTATYDGGGKNIIGYHSSRRVPNRTALDQIKPLYAALLAEEARHANGKEGMAAATQMILDTLSSMGVSYGQLIYTLEGIE